MDLTRVQSQRIENVPPDKKRAGGRSAEDSEVSLAPVVSGQRGNQRCRQQSLGARQIKRNFPFGTGEGERGFWATLICIAFVLLLTIELGYLIY